MIEKNYWLLRHGNEVFVTTGRDPEEIFPCATAAAFGNPANVLLVGEWRGLPCYAAEVEQLPAGMAGELMSLRVLFAVAGRDAFMLGARGVQLLDWQKNHRFCGRCATATTMKTSEFAKACPACELIVYPRISPVVMVLIERGNDLLLARSPHFKPGVFSALAGFVEAGETLEQCAVREVREEVGVEIANLRYFRSQPWPFPDSLMIAFFADYASGVVTPDRHEIEAADWFPRSALPPLPDPVSIARQLIDAACL